MGNHPAIDHELKQEQREQNPPTSEVSKANNLLESAAERAMAPENRGKPRTLLVISVQPTAKLRDEIAVGKQPRRDYDALQQALNADAIYLDDAQVTYVGRLIKRLFGPFAALSWTAFRQRHKYDIIYTDTEIIGLPLALLLKLSGTRAGHPRHVTLSHYLSPLKKRIFFRFGVRSHIDTMIVYCAAQHALATEVLHIPSERVVKLPFFVDKDFWRPLAPSADNSNAVTKVSAHPLICASGLEFRDYPTLTAAVAGLNVEVHIAAGSAFALQKASASSRYKTSSTGLLPDLLPPNVRVGSYDYATMLQLYAAARFIVVPLCQKDAPAGVTVILEAMAMGKAVIVSGTRGQTDVIRDPRNNGRGLVAREWWPGFLDTPGLAETLGRLPTGFYVTPGDVDDLRSSIQYLLDHPEVAEELGQNGRRVVEAYFDLDAWARRFAATIRNEPLPSDSELQTVTPIS